jgi:mannose-6-phosphate isomerase class I
MIYIGIRAAGKKYIVHPTTEQAYQNSNALKENNIWYYTSEKSIDEFAIAGAFGTYDSLAEAENTIKSVDPGIQNVYKPPAPPAE